MIKTTGPGAPQQALQKPEVEKLTQQATQALNAVGQASPEIQDVVMAQVQGTPSTIKKGLAARLLRRSAKDLSKLIGDTHLTTTTQTGSQVGQLRDALRDEQPKQIAAELTQIALNAGATKTQLESFVNKLEQLADLTSQGALDQIPKPMREKVQSLATMAGQELFSLAYKPLLQKVDVPES